MQPRYSVSKDERAAIKEEMRAIMIEQARARQTIPYSELAMRVPTAYLHPRSFQFASLLQEIGREEIEAGRGVLPAVVVRKDSGMPGGGYFGSTACMGHESAELEAWWRDDLETLYAYWAGQDTA